jgi:hypothetical protein
MSKKPGFSSEEYELVCQELTHNHKQLLDIVTRIQAAYGKTSKHGKEANATAGAVFNFLHNFKNNG